MNGAFLRRRDRTVRSLRVEHYSSAVNTARAADAPSLVKLVFRTYQQHPNDEWTPRALTLIDRLCLEGIGDAGQQLEQFDR